MLLRQSTRLIFIFLMVFLILSCTKDKKKEEIYPKKTDRVERGTIYLEVTATGAIKPQVGASVKVGARVSGKVERLLVRQGDYVRAGQLIAIIEHEDLKKEVERYEFEYKQALSQLEKIRKVYPENIKAKKNSVLALEAELAQIERELKRLEKLYREGLISKTDLERMERDREVKLHQLESAKAELKALMDEFEKEQERVKAQVEAAKRQVEEARVKLKYAFVYSPINGYVSEVTTQQGETVVAGLNAPTFITVIDLSRLEVHCYVDETDIGKIKPGLEATFKVDSFPDKIFKARVRTIYPGAIIKNNVVFYDTVLDILTPYENYLRPEMTAQVTIIADKKENALLVPSASIKIDKEGKQYVMVKKGDKWEKRIVKVGWESRGKTEILEGLKEGEVVGVW
ncbi:MAG: efflux RND transporter periplasmic adaptor subunit [Caldimicrobium sp.]